MEYGKGYCIMYTFKDLVEITAKLRAEDGCPWDREQTFESLRKYMREEAEEAVQAVDNEDMENLCEELGDVLFQVMLNSQIANEKGLFSIDDVIGGICEKMVRRHPWVFGGEKINSGRRRRGSLGPDKNAGKGQKTLTNHSKADINDRVSLTRIKTVRTCFFGSGLGGKH